MKLYHCIGARSFRPLWALEEMEADYELIMLPFPPRVFKKDYLAINPLGTIPFFIDGAARMTESTGICHYLTTTKGPTPLGVTPQEADYAAFLNWLYFSDATLTFPQTLVLRYTVLEPKERRQPQVAEDYAKWFYGRLRLVELGLEGKEFLAAGRFTIADIAVGYALFLADMLKLSHEFGPNVRAYWDRLKSRPGFGRALRKQQDEMKAQGVEPGVTV
jgi:glutathione S-transferase